MGAAAAGRAGASESNTGGEFTGRCEPRWQEKQVTCRLPRKLSLLMEACMAIISARSLLGAFVVGFHLALHVTEVALHPEG